MSEPCGARRLCRGGTSEKTLGATEPVPAPFPSFFFSFFAETIDNPEIRI